MMSITSKMIVFELDSFRNEESKTMDVGGTSSHFFFFFGHAPLSVEI